MPATVLLLLWKLLLICLLLAGWGWLAIQVLARFSGPSMRSIAWFEAAVVGAPAAYLFAACAALFWPLGPAVDVAFTLAGFAGAAHLLWKRRPEAGWFGWVGLPWVTLSGLVAWGTAHTPLNYDAGLYQLPFARLLELEPLSFGLANVHARFGFNSAMLPLSAVFRGPLLGEDGLFLVGPALWLIVAGATLELLNAEWTGKRLGPAFWFGWFGLAVWIFLLHDTAFSWFGLSPSADLAAGLYVFYASLTALAIAGGSGAPHRTLLLTAAITFAMVAKLSSAPVLLLLILVFRPVWRQRAAALLGAGVVGIWTLHAVILSGCVAFPFTSTCIGSLPWALDPEVVTISFDLIRSFARAPANPETWPVTGWDWLPAWRRDLLPHRQFLFALLRLLPWLLAAALAMRWVLRTGAGDWHGARALGAVGAIQLAGMTSVFLSAPDPRFAIGFLVNLAAATAAMAVCAGAGFDLKPNARRRLGWMSAVLLTGFVLQAAAWLSLSIPSRPVLAWRSLPRPAAIQMGDGEGFTLSAPAEGGQCWAIDDLCSPLHEIPPNLTRRRWAGRTGYALQGERPIRRLEQQN